MQKVFELSVDDLAVYENLQLYMSNCFNSICDYNLYRKIAGYKLDENYISSETNNIIINCN